jgi:beta-galactosidase
MNAFPSMRQKRLLDFGWKFFRGEIPFPEPRGEKGHIETYGSIKAGQVLGAAGPAFDDSQWKTVDLPHDWVIDQPFDPAATVSNGYLPRGVAWYRRAFVLESAGTARRFSLEFDGVFRDAQVWLNGHYLGRHSSGYTGFDFSISDIVYFDGIPNVLAVRTDSRDYEGWWYEGGGIYRHTWLVETPRLHLAKWGICARPRRISDRLWRVQIEVEIANDGLASAEGGLAAELFGPQGQSLGRAYGSVLSVAAKKSTLQHLEIEVKAPALWSLEDPALCRLRATLENGGEAVDEMEINFGFREIEFSPSGFFLNGRRVEIQGTCNHQDHAGVGIALPDRLQTWRLRQLKTAGCNAYRCAHHPPTPELLDACDREGILVLDENRHLRSSPEAMADLEAMVRRDRNHPSVIIWSICNEEYLQGSAIGGRIAATLAARVRELDPTRPITGALLSTSFGSGVEDKVDVIGINYNLPQWQVLHARHPGKAIVATETTAAVSTRGIYQVDESAGYGDAYDRSFCPGGTTIRDTWLAIRERPYMAGGFVWVGFDYRGEPAPYGWPAVGTQLGFLDMCGFRKDAFYLYQAFWTREPMLHLLPHWNWADREDQDIRVVAYSNCEKVELFLNGKSLGEKPVPADHAVEWMVPYRAGTLRAEARTGAAILARSERATTGEPGGVCFETETTELRADAEDVAIVTVKIVDQAGRFVPTAQVLVNFSINGPGRIIGVGNGNPTSYESDTASRRTTFNGLAQVLVQAGDQAGEIVLRGTAEGLSPSEIKLPSRPSPRRPFVAVPTSLRLVENWHRSPVTSGDDATQLPVFLDPTSEKYDGPAWEPIVPHSAFPNFLSEGQWIAYHSEINVPTEKATLAFSRVWGRGALYLDRKLFRPIEAGTESFSVEIPEEFAGKKISIDLALQYVYGGAGLNGWVWLLT